MPDHGLERPSAKRSWISGGASVAIGILFGAVSYAFYEDHQLWFSDAAMSVGSAFLLVAPILYFTRQLESRSVGRLVAVRDEIEADVTDIRRSINESRGAVQQRFAKDNARTRELIEAVKADTSRATVMLALQAADEVNLLSPIGVRVDAFTTDYFFRIRIDDERLIVHLDGLETPHLFTHEWLPSETFDDVSVALASDVRLRGHWPGDHLWDLATPLEQVIDTLLIGNDMRAIGRTTNVVQVISGDWIISDWDVMDMSKHAYQITLRRVHESDWFSHLREKSWVNTDTVGEMLDNASAIKTIADELLPGDDDVDPMVPKFGP